MIGPSVPPVGAGSSKKAGDAAAPSQSKIRKQIGPAIGPAARPEPVGAASAAPNVRRATVGPTAPPLATAAAAAVRRTSSAVLSRTSGENCLDAKVQVDSAAVALCRAGELPQKGWSSKWNSATKKAALLAALEAAQMHVVYALCPRSSAFQSDVGVAKLEQSELDRVLQAHATGKLSAPKARQKEALAWLLEEGASLEFMSASTDFEVRAAAARVLASLGGEEAAAGAANLLKSKDWQARATGAEAFAKLAADLARPHINSLADLLSDEQALVRTAAITALGRLGAEAAAPCAAFLSADRPRAREAAAEVLGKLGCLAVEHIEGLAALLEDRDWQVPTAAANALKRIGDAAAPHIATVIERCEQPSRPAATEALTRIGGPAAADAAAGLLSCEDVAVRRSAVEVLGAVGADACAPHSARLSALSTDADRDVRRAVKMALLKLGIRPELPQLSGNGDALPDAVAAALQGKGSSKDGSRKGSGKVGKSDMAKHGGERRKSRSRSRERKRSSNDRH